MAVDSFVLTSESQAEFYRHQPVDFFLYDEEGNANLYILNDNVPGKAHNLILINEGENDLTIAGNNTLPGPGNFHFELRFRPGTIDPDFHSWITAGTVDWLLQSKLWDENDPEVISGAITSGTVSLYLVYQLSETILASRTSRLIPLHGIKSGTGGGSRGAKAELRYLLNGNQIITGTGGSLHYRQERLEIINQRGVRSIPLEAGFAFGNRVLNNNDEENELNLQITNLLRNSFISFQGMYSEAPSRLILSFDTSEKVNYWALFDEDNAVGVFVNVNGTETYWHIEKEVQGQTVQWILSPSEEIELDAGESFLINLTQIKSGMPSGLANMYLQYENFPGYWDDLFVVPIEKTPFYFEDKQDTKQNTIRTVVGLGTHAVDQDGAALQIVGGLSTDSFHSPVGGIVPKGGIIMWSGTESDVPEGWNLCDGNLDDAGNPQPVNGMIIPDLRSRFIVGAGQGSGGLTAYNPNDKGGEENHVLAEDELPAHAHTHSFTTTNKTAINSISNIKVDGKTGSATTTTVTIKEVSAISESTPDFDNTTAVGLENRPPFYALAFILKV